VLVAVDLSASMNLADPQRTQAEKAALSRSLNLPEAAVDQVSRKEIARLLLSEERLDLLGRLQSQHRVELVGFHESVVDGADQFLPAPLQPADKSSAGTATNLNLPLQRALEPSGKHGGKLLGVVMLTDGQHNHGPPPLQQAKELAKQGIAVFPIGIGSRQSPIDVAVVDLQAPKQVFKDAEATVESKIRASGVPAQNLIVELSGSGKFAKQEKIIQHDGKDRVHTVSFRVKLDEVGAQRMEIRVWPSNTETRETTTDNNRLTTVVRVAPEKSRILLVDDEPRWEHHYLATALGRDPDLVVDRVLFTQPRIGVTPEDDLAKIGYARRQWPAQEKNSEDPLWQYDCIVVGDLAPEQLRMPERLRLERYIADRGGTLVIVAGKRHMPLDFFAAAADDPFTKLLPLQQPAIVQSKDGFAFVVNEAGEKIGFFQIDNDAESSRQRWLEMPKHFWAVTGAPKPGAVALARADRPALTKPNDSATDDAGVVLQQSYGFGKTLYVGLDSTWRWRYRIGDAYHHRFWGQLMRWAVSDPWLPEGNRRVRYGAKSPIYRHDQEVELTARLGEEAPSIAAASARIKLIRKEGDKEETIATVPLVQDEHRSKQWGGKIKQLPPGHYRIELDIPELRSKLAELPPGDKTVHGFTVLPPEDGELIDVATNWDLLQALAEQTQGRLFTAEDAEQLPSLLARQVERKETRREDRVWQDEPMVWWVLGVLLSVLTLEWILRKLAGLP
jgi:hypothetical protein